jgi:SAM-dependent methyltransferase/uncharacterized protein YbaR (Trm112 family)
MVSAPAVGTSWLERDLVCPRDRKAFRSDGSWLDCEAGHRYPVIDGIPVLLVSEAEPTHGRMKGSLEARPGGVRDRVCPPREPDAVDAFVQQGISGTNGLMYRSVIGRLRTYPVPALRLPRASNPGSTFLDIGCNWGRWSIAAHRLGYSPIGIDPWLEAVQAASRVASQLGVPARYVVADARHLPLRENSVEVAFSYSVLQHFAKEDTRRTFEEVGRVLKPDGTAMVQMANALGIRCLYHQARRRFREPRGFEVRYWTPGELRETVARLVGPATLAVDGYFTLNAQPAEKEVLPRRFRYLVQLSEILRRLSSAVAPLRYVADSLYVLARKTAR